jgi:catechol 2,3-dioxygenase-like lactoylglutathione lyase family enzyme
MTAAPSQQPPPIPTGLHLKRPCLAVADLDLALTLYRDILGFQVDYLSDTASPDSYLYSVFGLPSAAVLKFASLSTAHEARALALTEVKGIPLPSPALPRSMILVIQVPEIAPILAQIAALSLPILAPNTFTTAPNRQFTEQGICDYDGHLLMLYESTLLPITSP